MGDVAYLTRYAAAPPAPSETSVQRSVALESDVATTTKSSTTCAVESPDAGSRGKSGETKESLEHAVTTSTSAAIGEASGRG
jgi:hypothetical protein